MQRVRAFLVALAGILALAMLVFPRADDSPPPPAAASSLPWASNATVNTAQLTDSIRTDLNDYRWPTDAGYLVTSTFGEYRRTHFHGGIDISTGDDTGYRVFAARDGEVGRVRVDANGYGKMIYLRHSDGYWTTYAHLQSFAPAIEERVRAEQMRLQRYPVQLEFAAGETPVRKGDVVAYSGETGSGSPHLHFEIRDMRMEVINPMLAPHLRVQDDIPPTVRKMALIPLGEGSTVNGSPHPVTVPVRRLHPGSFAFTAPLRVVGAAGIGIAARDKGNGSRYSRGVYRHRLFIDDALVFEVRMDQLPMQESQQIGFHYLIDRGRFEKLYSDTRNTLLIYSDRTPGAGWLSTASPGPGRHRVRILSQDFAGNTTELSGTITLLNSPPLLQAREDGGTVRLSISPPGQADRISIEGRNSRGAWSALAVPLSWDSARSSASFALSQELPSILRIRAATADGAYSPPAFVVPRPVRGTSPEVKIETEIASSAARVVISSDGIFTSPPLVALEEGKSRRLLTMAATDERHYHSSFTPSDTVTGKRALIFEGDVSGTPVRAVETLDLTPILPGRIGAFDDGCLRLEYDSLSVFDTLYLQVRATNAAGIRIYDLLPRQAILRDGLLVTMRRDAPQRGEALYSRGSGDWTLLARPTESGPITARLSNRLASLALLTDTEGPVISRLRFIRRTRREVRATFRISDGLAGVDYKEVKAYIDGKFVVPEIDGEHRRATVAAPGWARGPHRLKLHVRDRVGNPSLLERDFFVP